MAAVRESIRTSLSCPAACVPDRTINPMMPRLAAGSFSLSITLSQQSINAMHLMGFKPRARSATLLY